MKSTRRGQAMARVQPMAIEAGETPAEEPGAAALAAALREAARQMRAVHAFDEPRVAVLLPCYNEAASIAQVIADFRAALPKARICVFDNASSDGTGDVARAAGADVFFVAARGKGNVVRAMFADVDADIYLMADGDGTYDAASAPRLVAAVRDDHVDMAIGARANVRQNAHRRGHAVGNRLFNALYARLFGAEYGDIFSGYRAFSRRFVKSFPALSAGFEIETELSVHASQMKLPTSEIETPYGKRVEGSPSKLNSLRDGWRILMTFAYLLKETRPGLFFGAPALGVAAAAIALAIPLIETWLATGLVPRMPTAILCTGLMLLAGLLGACGLILDSLARSRAEHKRMLYLALSGRR
ncbi:MAG: glycosyltransferase [Methylobacteriaceae bacterium]|nr:glycosyltransferase [Methylobacteriaceae bacterium]